MMKKWIFLKELLTYDLYALHAITMWKVKILKDIGNSREKHDVNKNIKKITNPMKKSIGNMKKVTAKLLSVK